MAAKALLHPALGLMRIPGRHLVLATEWEMMDPGKSLLPATLPALLLYHDVTPQRRGGEWKKYVSESHCKMGGKCMWAYTQGPAEVFYTDPESKYVRLCRLYSLCGNCSVLRL